MHFCKVDVIDTCQYKEGVRGEGGGGEGRGGEGRGGEGERGRRGGKDGQGQIEQLIMLV